MSQLHVIHEAVHRRVDETISSHSNWPCRKGCDDCCRHLASIPLVSRPEWEAIRRAMESLPAETARQVRQRIRDSGSASRPFLCPLLNTATGSCLIYEARPVACRAYGFYAEREGILGCARIEALSLESPDVVWGNHRALEEELGELGMTAPLTHWLDSAPDAASCAST